MKDGPVQTTNPKVFRLYTTPGSDARSRADSKRARESSHLVRQFGKNAPLIILCGSEGDTAGTENHDAQVVPRNWKY